MRKLKILGLVTVVFVCLLLLCSCTCDPSRYSWSIVQIHHDVTYANGHTVRTSTTSNVYEAQPVGVSSDDINIEFYEDGRVRFKPYDSEPLYGNYALNHNGMRDTNFTVTFDNGEKIEDGYAISYYYASDISFSFRGVSYEFTETTHDTNTDEELRIRTEWLIKEVRNEKNPYMCGGVVTLEDGGGRLSSEKLDEDIDLFSVGYAVTAVHITDNNELIILDELRDGECRFVELYGGGVVIYYIDPLPNESVPGEPVEYGILDIIPELKYYMEHPENTLLKLTREHSPAMAGEFNEHIYENKSSEIEFWLASLSEITLIESDSPPYDVDEQHIKYTMRFEDKTEENSRVIISYECGMIRRGDKWYDCSTFPTWYGGRPVYSFSCMNYSMYVWGGGIRYFAIDGIEFEPDKKQDYEYPEEHWTLRLEGDVGEIIVYDETHFYYNGTYYIVTSEKNFAYIYS